MADDEVLVKLNGSLERRLLPIGQELKVLNATLVRHDAVPSVLCVLTILVKNRRQVGVSDREGAREGLLREHVRGPGLDAR